MGYGKKKCFTRKNGLQKGGSLYKWCPDTSDKRGKKRGGSGGAGANGGYFCTTELGTEGNDFISTYSYVIVVVGGQVNRTAYVQCNYVK